MNKNKRIILLVAALLVVAAFFLILINHQGFGNSQKNQSVQSQSAETSDETQSGSLIGTWLYKDGTKYRFAEDNTGGMIIDNYEYKFEYSAESGNLTIDFQNKEVHDSKYEYSFEDGKLKLIGGEGTAGGEYFLTRA